MTKEITRAYILQEMQDKLGLREYEAASFLFSETVVPTYNIEQHLLTPEVKTQTREITSADMYEFYTIPANEKWFVHGYNIIFVTGSYTVAGVVLTRPTPTDYIYIDLKAAQSVSYAVNLPKDIELHYQDDLRVYVDGYTSTGNLMLIIDVTVETIR